MLSPTQVTRGLQIHVVAIYQQKPRSARGDNIWFESRSASQSMLSVIKCPLNKSRAGFALNRQLFQRLLNPLPPPAKSCLLILKAGDLLVVVLRTRLLFCASRIFQRPGLLVKAE